MAALCTSDPGKAVSQNATVQITVDHGPKIGTVKTISPLKALLIDLFKVLEMILNTLVIGRILRLVVHRLFEIFGPTDSLHL